MSEPKAMTVFDAYLLARSDNDLVYLKSEADKVIAELKESVKGLILDNYLKDKELRRQKYKRCVDNAELWLERYENSTDDVNMEVSLKRHKKWLELAEQFKEAK